MGRRDLFFWELSDVICSIVKWLMVSGIFICKLIIRSTFSLHKFIQRGALISWNPWCMSFRELPFLLLTSCFLSIEIFSLKCKVSVFQILIFGIIFVRKSRWPRSIRSTSSGCFYTKNCIIYHRFCLVTLLIILFGIWRWFWHHLLQFIHFTLRSTSLALISWNEWFEIFGLWNFHRRPRIGSISFFRQFRIFFCIQITPTYIWRSSWRLFVWLFLSSLVVSDLWSVFALIAAARGVLRRKLHFNVSWILISYLINNSDF